MKSLLKYVLLSLMLTLVFVACGKKDDGGGNNGGGYNAYAAYCQNQPGTVPTTQCGCVPQTGCPAGQGMCNGVCVAQGIPNNGSTCTPGMIGYPNCNQTGICQPGMANYPNCGGQTGCTPGMPGCGTGTGGNAQQMAQYICQLNSNWQTGQLQAIQHPQCQSGWACSSGWTYGCVYF